MLAVGATLTINHISDNQHFVSQARPFRSGLTLLALCLTVPSLARAGSDSAGVFEEEVWWLPDPVPSCRSVLIPLHLQHDRSKLCGSQPKKESKMKKQISVGLG